MRRDICLNQNVTWDEVELAYVRLQSNVREFFSQMRLNSDGRGLRISYENLLRRPVHTLTAVSHLLGLEFQSGMDEPYESADALASFQAGSLIATTDPKLMRRKKIDGTKADAWRRVQLPHALCAQTIEVANAYGYELDVGD